MSWLLRHRPPFKQLATHRRPFTTNPPISNINHLLGLLIDKFDEEMIHDYKPEHWYPAKLGETINDRYQLVSKLGYGASSTVWLAKDVSRTPSWWWQRNQYATLKIMVNKYAPEHAIHEATLSEHISKANPSHPGRRFVRTATDSFNLVGANGVHPVLVYEPMREPLNVLQRRLDGETFAPDLLKTTLGFILSGLDYLHSECHVIHTDLKPDNILVPFESPKLLDRMAESESKNPSPSKVRPDGRTVYLSRRNFGDLMPGKSIGPPQISDFGVAERVVAKSKNQLTHRIQLAGYVAPEVCLGAPWSFSVDIWNLGVMIWELMEGERLFEGRDPDYDRRTERMQLADVISLLGPPPKSLLSRGKKSHLFFDPFGRFKHKKIIPPARALADTITALRGHDKDAFIDFASCMLVWEPEKRKSAKELLNHPWLAQ